MIRNWTKINVPKHWLNDFIDFVARFSSAFHFGIKNPKKIKKKPPKKPTKKTKQKNSNVANEWTFGQEQS